MNIFYKKKKINREGGFTLLETLVAIFILLLATTGPMVFAQSGLRSAFLSRDQITAFFLAQDVIEYIKNVRDGTTINIINSAESSYEGWLDSPRFDSCFEDGCTIDTTAYGGGGDIRACSRESTGASDPGPSGCLNDKDSSNYNPLYYYEDQDTSYYTTLSGNGASPSIFAREIKMREIEKDNEVEITVVVRWKSHEGIGVREVVVKENIFNWASALLN